MLQQLDITHGVWTSSSFFDHCGLKTVNPWARSSELPSTPIVRAGDSDTVGRFEHTWVSAAAAILQSADPWLGQAARSFQANQKRSR